MKITQPRLERNFCIGHNKKNEYEASEAETTLMTLAYGRMYMYKGGSL